MQQLSTPRNSVLLGNSVLYGHFDVESVHRHLRQGCKFELKLNLKCACKAER